MSLLVLMLNPLLPGSWVLLFIFNITCFFFAYILYLMVFVIVKPCWLFCFIFSCWFLHYFMLIVSLFPCWLFCFTIFMLIVLFHYFHADCLTISRLIPYKESCRKHQWNCRIYRYSLFLHYCLLGQFQIFFVILSDTVESCK